MSIFRTNTNTSDWEEIPGYDEVKHDLTRVGVERPFRSGFVVAEPHIQVAESPPDGAIFVLEGEAHVETGDGESMVLKPGDLVSFEKGIRQTWKVVEHYKAVVFYLDR
jgi:uncharacterized cupin superfamily protein